MKNFTFKVIPNQVNLENNSIKPFPENSASEPEAMKKPCPCPPQKPIYEEPCPPKKECPKHETPPVPCPPCPPKEPEEPKPCPPMPSPCPPMEPLPCPPCPPMGPKCPQMPCPYGESGMMMPNYQQCSGNSAPPFTCPYFRLAHAYVPWQCLNTVFSPAEALCQGTLFPELNMPQGQYGPCEGPRPCKVYFGGGVPYGCK